MKLLALVQGNYGRRMVEAWKTHGPAQWEIVSLEITTSLPQVMEDAAQFLPPEIPQADLVISLGENAGGGGQPRLAPPWPGQTVGARFSADGSSYCVSRYLLCAQGG